MDIGKDVLTKTIIGTTDAEKVFTPWWITLHHYLVYTLVVLGKTFKPSLCDIVYAHPNNEKLSDYRIRKHYHMQ